MQAIGSGESVDAHVTVEDHLLVHGMAKGGVHVPRNASLEVHGMVSEGITVDPGGRAAIYGMCNGGLTNNGEVDVYGTLRGGIQGNGRTRVSTDALIDGIPGRDLDWEATPPVPPATKIKFPIDIAADGTVTVGEGAEKIETPVVVEGHFQIQGAAVAGARVLADGWLIVMGAVTGGITVDPGGHMVLYGACTGGLVNHGEADIFGAVFGGISGTGQTRVSPESVVDLVKGRDLGWEPAVPTRP